MQPTTHTPGPWTASNEAADSFGHTLNVRNGKGYRIASVVSPSLQDARLIAAAPELLACAEAVVETFQVLLAGNPMLKHLVHLRAAIAKAKGEAS